MKLTEIGMIFDLNSGPIQSDLVRCGTGQRGEDITKDYLRLPKVTKYPKGSGTLPFLYLFFTTNVVHGGKGMELSRDG